MIVTDIKIDKDQILLYVGNHVLLLKARPDKDWAGATVNIGVRLEEVITTKPKQGKPNN